MSPPTRQQAAADIANYMITHNDPPINLPPDQSTEPIPDNQIQLKANEAIGDKLNQTKHHTHTSKILHYKPPWDQCCYLRYIPNSTGTAETHRT